MDIVKKDSTQVARDKEELRKKEKEKESIMQRMLPVLPIVSKKTYV